MTAQKCNLQQNSAPSHVRVMPKRLRMRLSIKCTRANISAKYEVCTSFCSDLWAQVGWIDTQVDSSMP